MILDTNWVHAQKGFIHTKTLLKVRDEAVKKAFKDHTFIDFRIVDNALEEAFVSDLILNGITTEYYWERFWDPDWEDYMEDFL